jgi:hypothetical protein
MKRNSESELNLKIRIKPKNRIRELCKEETVTLWLGFLFRKSYPKSGLSDRTSSGTVTPFEPDLVLHQAQQHLSDRTWSFIRHSNTFRTGLGPSSGTATPFGPDLVIHQAQRCLMVLCLMNRKFAIIYIVLGYDFLNISYCHVPFYLPIYILLTFHSFLALQVLVCLAASISFRGLAYGIYCDF